MEFQQLRYFVEVARLRNFTRAAEVCLVAQPSLSQQIQKLERELGGPLFHRLGRQIVLTDLGEAMLTKAERLLQQREDALKEAEERVAKGGVVRFGSILTMAPYLVPRVVALSKRRSLSAGFEIAEDFTENLLRKLKAGELDFAIMSTPVDEPGMLVRVIAREPFVAVMPASHGLARKQKVTLDALFAEPFLPLSHIHCAGQQIRDLCQIKRRQPSAAIQSSQIETILRLVEQGVGVTILPHMAVAGMKRRGLVFKPLVGRDLYRDIALVQHQDRYISNSSRAFIGLIEESLQELVEPLEQ